MLPFPSYFPVIFLVDSIKLIEFDFNAALFSSFNNSYLWEEWKERTKETPEVVSSNFRNLKFLSLEVQPEVSLPILINYLHSHTKLVSYEEFECSV